jgi:1-deoxy-D-xylulose-5-phosphate reductoisomerase
MMHCKKKVALLGATGSIGRSTLDVLRRGKADFDVTLLSSHSKRDDLLALGAEFPDAALALSGATARGDEHARDGAISYCGNDGLTQAIRESGAHIVVNGIAGAAGLAPSLAALDAGMDLALANKETIVMAGPLVLALAREKKARVLPVDSEHSAINNLLEAHGSETLDALLLTASGGPFRTYTVAQLATVQARDALKHPTWNMGAKISIDSASMANKGLEVIEAARLFDAPPDKIRVVVHPQSVVHSMISFADGSVYAQLSLPDMRLPIQNALYYPRNAPSGFDRLSFDHLSLTFEPPDGAKFPLLPLAYDALRAGPLYPAVYNAANEVAVAAFLAARITFPAIARVVRAALERDWTGALTLERVLDTDARAREAATYTVTHL